MTAPVGRLIITCSSGTKGAVTPTLFLVADAATGKNLDMVTRMVLDVDCATRVVTAELTRITQRRPGGDHETDTTLWFVAEIRTAP